MQPDEASSQSEPDPQWEAISQFPVIGPPREVVLPLTPARPVQSAFSSAEMVRSTLSALVSTIHLLSRELLNVGRVAQAINVAILAAFAALLYANWRLPFGMPATWEVISQSVMAHLTLFAILGGPFFILFAASCVVVHDGPRTISAMLALIGTICVCLCCYACARVPGPQAWNTLLELLFWFASSYVLAVGFGLAAILCAARANMRRDAEVRSRRLRGEAC